MEWRVIDIIKLDYTIESPEERNKIVQAILAETPNPSEQYLEILADYLVLCMEKKERKERKILTENRMATVNKRETSYEGLVGQLENGEDSIHNLIAENKKNIILTPKVSITKKDLDEIPPLRQLRDSIKRWEALQEKATGKDAFLIKRSLIEMRRDQYIIKNAYRRPIVFAQLTHTEANPPKLESKEWVEYDENEIPIVKYSGVSFLDPNVVAAVLQNLGGLRGHCTGQFDKDTWYFVQDFNSLLERALSEYPMYAKIIEYKVDHYTNQEIQTLLEQEFHTTHSLEYISSLWRNKIPKLIAQQAQDDFLLWYFTFQKKGKWKKCSRCGQIKLAHNRFFSINKTSRDGFYSICKCCRNKKRKQA